MKKFFALFLVVFMFFAVGCSANTVPGLHTIPYPEKYETHNDEYDDVLILADPYDITDHYQDGYYTYPLGRFTSLWFEGSCTANEEPYQQPFVTAYPSN